MTSYFFLFSSYSADATSFVYASSFPLRKLFFFYPIENKSTDNDNDDDLGFVGSGGLNVELNDVATKADGKNGRKAQKKMNKRKEKGSGGGGRTQMAIY